MHVTSIILGLIIVLNIVFSMFVVFRERRDAGSTWAWLLVLSFIPILGFILYLLFAQNLRRIRLFHWDDLQKTGIEKVLLSQMEGMSSGNTRFATRPPRITAI